MHLHQRPCGLSSRSLSYGWADKHKLVMHIHSGVVFNTYRVVFNDTVGEIENGGYTDLKGVPAQASVMGRQPLLHQRRQTSERW